MVVVTCKNEEIHPKITALEWSQQISHYMSGDFSRRSRAANFQIQGLIWPNFRPIRAFIVVLVTCKSEKDQIKNEGARVVAKLLFSDAQGQLIPKSVMESCQNSNSSKLLW